MILLPYYLFPLLFVPLAHGLPRDTCTALASGLQLENTTIISASHIPSAGTITTMGVCQSQAAVSSPICRVQFVVNTTSTSAVFAEAWLPDTWYGRYLTVGNGGLGGCIDYSNLDYGASLHFATIGSNNGHDGLDGHTFLNNPEVINDFAFRAIHVSTLIGKQIVQAYYGSPHQKSYYLGCSTGGRQGTQSALKFPEDFDGIVAGAPATDWNHLVGLGAMLARYIGAPNASTSPSFISADLWELVAAEILAQCDELDGVRDGIITEPDACDFRPEALLCSGNGTAGCLSIAQVEALRKIYQPLYGVEGQLLYPRPDPGCEADGNTASVLNGTVVSFSNDWFKYAIYNDT
ncbi:putative feruloyl esterase B, partial [Termitomyces sp. T112]